LHNRSNVTNKSVLAVQIFDQKKFKKKDQGFLGTVNIQMGDVFDVNVGGDGKPSSFFLYISLSYASSTVAVTNATI
jgi:hypothetical protein